MEGQFQAGFKTLPQSFEDGRWRTLLRIKRQATLLIFNRETRVCDCGSDASVPARMVWRLLEEQPKPFNRFGRKGKRSVALASQPRNRDRVTNLVRIAALCHERPCFVVRCRQEACSMPVRAPELERLNDFCLNLRAWIGRRKLRSQIHAVYPALGRDRAEQMLARRLGSAATFERRSGPRTDGRKRGAVCSVSS